MKIVSCESDCKMLDLKTRYDIEIPWAGGSSFTIAVNNGTLEVCSAEKDGSSKPMGTWNIEEGVHTEAMTAEFRDGVLYIRLPKGDEVRPRELQYSEKIEITPLA